MLGKKINNSKFFIGGTQVQSHHTKSATNQKQSNDQWVVVSSTTRPSSWEEKPPSSASGSRWAVVPSPKRTEGNLLFSFLLYKQCFSRKYLGDEFAEGYCGKDV